MNFFNDFSKKIISVAEITANKAKDIADVTKLNAEIYSLEKEIDNLYNEIGKIVFELNAESNNTTVHKLCAKIKESLAKVEALKKEILAIKANVNQDK